ncbi:MAG: NAD+ synthase [Candidatus Levybacteria bacterium]|nr:NAD+ synthase [Candidatus Levybacteria bacterium]
MFSLPQINPEAEEKKIVSFLRKTFHEQKIEKAVIGVSGGIDSSVSLTLLAKAIPAENILALNLPYFNEIDKDIPELEKTLNMRITTVSIKKTTDEVISRLEISEEEALRRGNISARVRMIVLYDFAKKHSSLVVGTENRSEHHMGYFTRFGDEASDIEPIQHLYKTQVYELARYLGIPRSIIDKSPSANLWQQQTDEGEFGFSYAEADQVLYRYFDKKEKTEQIEKDFPSAGKIIDFANKNSYKHHVPYHL